MPLLLTQDDLRPLIEGSQFFDDLFHVIRDALLQRHGNELGHLSWLAFPLGQEGRRFNINALATPTDGTSIRVFPVSGGDIHPASDGYFAFLIDNKDGRLQALMSTDDLSPLRTSAPVGLACAYLARPDTTTLAMLGSGVQARYHLRAIARAIPALEVVHVFSPTVEHRQQYASEMSKETGLRVVPMASVQDALENADIVSITTTGRAPIKDAAWIRPGTLIVSITGQGIPNDLSTRLVVPALEGPAVRASGWDPRPVMATTGGRDRSTIAATLQEIILGTAQARLHSDDIVVYEQRGSYAWDALLLRWAYDWAREHGAGTPFHLTANDAHGKE
jgi:ornithine cyclodeaminase/alanine dehydrogenase-like protein (mu-crystallin family)